MGGAPIELLALNDPYPGVIGARVEGEPSFSHVQDMGDAFQAATARGVRIVMSERLADELESAGDLPPALRKLIEIRPEQ